MFTITLTGAQGHRKLFKLQFLPKGNEIDLAVHLPYFEHSHGKVGLFRLTSPPGGTNEVSLIGRDSFTTTQRVKLSHHRDGTVLFSQDGRVKSTVRTVGTPVRKLHGHFFTFQFAGLSGFASAGKSGLDAPNKTNATVYFGIDDDLDPDAVGGRIVGSCFRQPSVRVSSAGGGAGDPRFPIIDVDQSGGGHPAILVAPLNPPSDGDIIIVLTYHSMSRTDLSDDHSLLVTGGFRNPPYTGGPDGDATFIGIKYAQEDVHWDDLVSQLGSIDYIPGATGDSDTQQELQLVDLSAG